MRPPMPSVVISRRAKIALSVVGVLIVLIVVLFKFSGTYVDYLWFGEVGRRDVFSTVLWTKVVLFVVFGALMALIIGGNLVAAYLIKPPFRPMSPEQQNLQSYVLMVEPRRKLILGGAMGIAFLAAGASAQGDWQLWQTWLNGQSFGVTDPQFHLDISFYAWDYPMYRTLLSFGFTAVIFSLVLVIGIHYLSGAIRLQTPGPKITIAARRQITILVFVFMLLKAAAYWLDRYGFVFSDRSKFTGASYTDVHSALPAKTILFWITIILAIGVLASLWLRSALLPGIGFVVLLILSILIGGIYPAIVQQVSVKPNAQDKEAPYIKKNITATRQAYGIVTDSDGGGVHYENYQATATPSRDAITATNTTVDNIRILDPNVVGATFSNAQKIAQPYGFASTLNVDRYATTVGGTTAIHDYVVGARELVPSNLTGSLNTWINQHTVYTHGYGFVAAEADNDVTNGKPSDYTEGDIPPVGPLGVTTPQVYYGQLMNDYSIVGDKNSTREYDGNSQTTTYTGKGGVSLSSPLTKLAFALKYKETSFLLNDAVGASGARVIFNRDPKQRVEKIAPFLKVDAAPYPIVDKATGHIVWMVDGYTTFDNYPYSERQSLAAITGTSLRQGQRDTEVNYIKNSVKATVDAYDGTVHLYQWDTKDPVLKTWMKVFPGLVESVKKMPADIRSHVRYPQDLFNAQRALLAQYHINNAVAFYNGRGKWEVPADPFAAGNQPAYYVLADPPGSTASTPQFQLTTPMVVPNAASSVANLAAYVSVNSDPGPNYGKITVLQVPGKSAVQGPGQVANVFKTKAQISKDIQQLDNGQSRVLHGNLLTLPLGNSFLYVEPLYVQSSFPTLQRVLVTYGDKIGYGATLASALYDITSGRDTGSSLPGAGGGSDTTKPPTPTPGGSSGASTSQTPSSSTTPPTTNPGSVTSILTRLDTAVSQLDAAYKSGDPVRIGQAEAKIKQLSADYQAARSKAPGTSPRASSTPTSTPTR
ncbi:MAG: UPF0182 family protein [Actinomycetota bacterium]|nr:UPF0182 family protein [Actinomycetota bacterium]